MPASPSSTWASISARRSDRSSPARSRRGHQLAPGVPHLRLRDAHRHSSSSSSPQQYLGNAGLRAGDVPPRTAQAHLDAGRRRVRAGAARRGDVVRSARTCPPRNQLAHGLFVAAGRARGRVLRLRAVLRRARSPPRRRRVGVIIVFFFCAALFWGGFEQQGTTFNTSRSTTPTARSSAACSPRACTRPRGTSRSTPSFIILFAPFFAWIWVSLGARNMDPSAPFKMGFGLLLLGVGFLDHDVRRAARGFHRRQGRAARGCSWPT